MIQSNLGQLVDNAVGAGKISAEDAVKEKEFFTTLADSYTYLTGND